MCLYEMGTALRGVMPSVLVSPLYPFVFLHFAFDSYWIKWIESSDPCPTGAINRGQNPGQPHLTSCVLEITFQRCIMNLR